ncbi:NFACT family protein [Eubacteriales bacterium KG125]
MAFDGIMAWAVSLELSEKLALGKIEKIYQPEKDSIILQIHTKTFKHKVFISAASNSPRICLTNRTLPNPTEPPMFCMVLRKHLQGGRISEIRQRDSERIIEIDFQVLDELGFSVSKRLVIEIMGKHSNIVLINIKDMKIIDSIKRISVDVNRARQILPGLVYEYPPSQDKIGFKIFIWKNKKIPISKDVNWCDSASIMKNVAGISPKAAEIIATTDGLSCLENLQKSFFNSKFYTNVYFRDNKPIDFHVLNMHSLFDKIKCFDSPSEAIEAFFQEKEETNITLQQKISLTKQIKYIKEKLGLKLQRMSEDVEKAKSSEHLRLYGELLTANLHLLKKGDSVANLVNYYTGNTVDINLDNKLSPSENAQKYFWRYGKAMNTIKEKQPMIESVLQELNYIDSVLQHLENADDAKQVQEIKYELIQEGYIKNKIKEKKRQKTKKHIGTKTTKKSIPNILTYTSPQGNKIYVGRNNNENDILTLKMSSKSDLWFHTKDIPGSHVILSTKGKDIDDLDSAEIKVAASIAAYYSKGRLSSNVPVDYVQVKYIKKPAGAKPGMVIFKNNKTIWIDPFNPHDLKL